MGHDQELETGQYVTTRDGLTGYIFSKKEVTVYEIAICERDEERTVSHNDLALWKPSGGELEPIWY